MSDNIGRGSLQQGLLLAKPRTSADLYGKSKHLEIVNGTLSEYRSIASTSGLLLGGFPHPLHALRLPTRTWSLPGTATQRVQRRYLTYPDHVNKGLRASSIPQKGCGL